MATSHHFAVSSRQNGSKDTRLILVMSKWIACFTVLFVVIIVIMTSFQPARTILTPHMMDNTPTTDNPMFDHLGRYVMHNFDQKKPMANFLSGLSGFWGVPMVMTKHACSKIYTLFLCDVHIFLTPQHQQIKTLFTIYSGLSMSIAAKELHRLESKIKME